MLIRRQNRKGEDRVARLEARLLSFEETTEDFQLFLDYSHLTDELVFYGTRKNQIGSFVFTLASLFFVTVFKHKIFTKVAAQSAAVLELLSKWFKRFHWFLGFFPDTPELAHLRKIEQELLALRGDDKVPRKRSATAKAAAPQSPVPLSPDPRSASPQSRTGSPFRQGM